MSERYLAFAILAALACAGTSPAAQAQAPLPLDGRLVQARTDTFHVTYAGSRIGIGITSRSRTTTGSDAQLVQVYRWQAQNGAVIVDSLYADAKTLRTVREVRVIADTTIEMNYLASAIAITGRAKGAQVLNTVVPVEAGVLSSATLEAVIEALPLGVGFEREYKFFYAPPASQGIAPIRITVTGSELVSGRGVTKHDAWVVAASTPNGGTTFWIDKATRTVLKFDTQEGPATIEFRR